MDPTCLQVNISCSGPLSDNSDSEQVNQMVLYGGGSEHVPMASVYMGGGTGASGRSKPRIMGSLEFWAHISRVCWNSSSASLSLLPIFSKG